MAGVVVHSVFEAAPNVGDHRVRRARRDVGGVRQARRISRSRTTRPTPQQVRVTLTRGTGVALRPDRRRSAPAKPCARSCRSRRPAARACVAHVSSAPTNALAVDDEAVAWMAGAEPLAVTVVSDAARRRSRCCSSAIPACARRSSRRRPIRPVRDGVVDLRSLAAGRARRRRPRSSIAPPAVGVARHGAAPTSGRRAGRRPATHPVRGRRRSADGRHQARARRTTADGLVPVARVRRRHAARVGHRRARSAVIVVWSFALGRLESRDRAGVSRAHRQRARVARASVVRRPRRPGPVALPASTSRVVAPDGAAGSAHRAPAIARSRA